MYINITSSSFLSTSITIQLTIIKAKGCKGKGGKSGQGNGHIKKTPMTIKTLAFEINNDHDGD